MTRPLVILALALTLLLVPAAAQNPTRSGGGGTLAVLNKADGTVTLIDAATREALATITVGRGPHEAATSPDGKLVVVCNYGDRRSIGNTLSVIELAGRKVVRTVDLGKFQNPHGIAFLKDGRRVVVTVERQKAVLVVDVIEGKVLQAARTDAKISHMVAVGADEKRAFVANIGSGSMSVIDLEKGALVKVVATGAGAEGIAVHPTRKEVWVTNRAADSVSIVDSASLEIVATIPCAMFPIRVAFTPDGRHALVSCAKSNDVAVIDVAGREVSRRIASKAPERKKDDRGERVFGAGMTGAVPVGILVPPRGGVAYVANTYADTVSIVDLAGWKVIGHLVAGREPDGLAWSARVSR